MELSDLWSRLGYSDEKKQNSLAAVASAVSVAKNSLLVEVREAVSQKKTEVRALESKLSLYCECFGLSESHYSLEKGDNHDPSLVSQSLALTATLTRVVEDVTGLVANAMDCKDRLLVLVMDMGMEMGELPSALQRLMKMDFSGFPGEAARDGDYADSIQTFVQSLKSLNIVLNKGLLEKFRSDILELNSSRACTITRSINVLSDVKQLAELLGLATPSDLTEIGEKSGLGEMNATGLQQAVEAILSTSSSNPSGSERLLVALEQMRLGLKSALVNRESAFSLLKDFLRAVDAVVSGDPKGVMDSCQVTEAQHSKAAIMGLLARIQNVGLDLKSQLNLWGPTFASLIVESGTWNPDEHRGAGTLSGETTDEQTISMLVENAVKKAEDGSRAVLMKQRMEDMSSDLSEQIPFVEELWLSTGLEAVHEGYKLWSGDLMKLFIIREEVARLKTQSDLVSLTYCLTNSLPAHNICHCRNDCVGKGNPSFGRRDCKERGGDGGLRSCSDA